jgi:hypothetical protein
MENINNNVNGTSKYGQYGPPRPYTLREKIIEIHLSNKIDQAIRENEANHAAEARRNARRLSMRPSNQGSDKK